MFAAAILLCSNCHPRIAASFARTPMANTSGVVRPAEETPGQVFHSPSRTRYAIERTGQTLLLKWGSERVELRFFIGSRRMGRSYAHVDQGYLYQAPVGYYGNKRSWDVAPGYEADRSPDLDRPITPECLFCHASGAVASSGTLNRFLNLPEAGGVTCERCHGDGARHASDPRADNIVNPARLAPEARSTI